MQHFVPMKRSMLTMASIILGAFVFLCLIVAVTHRSFIYFPTSGRQSGTSAVSLNVTGATLQVTTRVVAGHKALVYFGGNAEDVSWTLADFAEAFPDRSLYMLHYRGYGGSTGRPTKVALHGDAKAVYQMVSAVHDDVMVVGRSLGSGVAVRLAAEAPVSRLVLVTPFDSLLTVAKRVAPYLPMSLLMRDRYESWRFAPRIKSPTRIIMAAEDELIPASSTEALFRAFAPGVATLQVIRDCDHNSISIMPEYWTVMASDN